MEEFNVESLKPGFTVSVVGSISNSIKCMNNILEKIHERFSEIIIFSRPSERDYKYSTYPNCTIYDGYNSDAMFEITKRIKNTIHNSEALIIFNDFGKHSIDEQYFHDILFNGRHMNISMILNTPSVTSFSPMIRANIGYYLLVDGDSVKFYDLRGGSLNEREEFEKIRLNERQKRTVENEEIRKILIGD
jgi:predicted transcriptional regulator